MEYSHLIVADANNFAHMSLHLDLHGIFTMSQGGFILEVIQIDHHYHLEVTVAQQGHFGIKSTVAQVGTIYRFKLRLGLFKRFIRLREYPILKPILG